MTKVVVISTHPDDETLGCSGTLLKHRDYQDNLYWIIVTSIFERQGFSGQKILKRQLEIQKVASLYRFSQIYELKFPTMELSDLNKRELINSISSVFHKIEPEIVYLPNRSDIHSDHQITFDAAFACTKPFRYPFIKKVLSYECISETEFSPPFSENAFLPNYFIDITEYIEKKLAIMSVYESETANPPFPRSLENIKALATFRGSMANVKFAEAFQLLKFIG